MELLAVKDLTLDLSGVDIFLLIVYFVFVIGIGFALKRAVKSTASDFFLSGRSLPAWITGLGLHLGQPGRGRVLGQSAFGGRVRRRRRALLLGGRDPGDGVPRDRDDALLLRVQGAQRSGVPAAEVRPQGAPDQRADLHVGLAADRRRQPVRARRGDRGPARDPAGRAIVLSAVVRAQLHPARRAVQRHLQRGPAVLRDPRRPDPAGGDRGQGGRRAQPAVRDARRRERSDVQQRVDRDRAGWRERVRRLLRHHRRPRLLPSFGYWTTNFAEVQRAMAAKSTNAARMTPIIGAYPKLFIPLITILPGMCALVLIPRLGQTDADGVEYNNAIPALMDQYLPAGALGVAVTGLVAAFMAGMAANVSSSTPSSPMTCGRSTSVRGAATTTTSWSAGSRPSPVWSSGSAPRTSPRTSRTSRTTSRCCSRSSTCRCSYVHRRHVLEAGQPELRLLGHPCRHDRRGRHVRPVPAGRDQLPQRPARVVLGRHHWLHVRRDHDRGGVAERSRQAGGGAARARARHGVARHGRGRAAALPSAGPDGHGGAGPVRHPVPDHGLAVRSTR